MHRESAMENLLTNETASLTELRDPKKVIEAIIGRIDTRIAYGMIRDPFELAACYAC